MILAYYGVPRSGKSCGAVKYIVDSTGLTPDEFYNAMTYGGSDFLTRKLQEHGKYSEIYHNIEGFPVFNNITGDEISCLLHDWEKEPSCKRLMVLDECHRFLDRPPSEVINFLAYHGHYGFDLILITQSPFLLPRKITVLAEIEYTAVRRSFRIANELRYSVGAGGEKTDVEVIKKPSQYFRLYKSATVHKKPKNQLLKFVGIFAVLCLLILSSLWFLFNGLSSRSSAAAAEASASSDSVGEASPRARAGAPPPVRPAVQVQELKEDRVWQEASTVTLTSNGQTHTFVVVDGVLRPVELYLKTGEVEKAGRRYMILTKREVEVINGIFDN